jgi:hypothetical protein
LTVLVATNTIARRLTQVAMVLSFGRADRICEMRVASLKRISFDVDERVTLSIRVERGAQLYQVFRGVMRMGLTAR